MVYLTTDITDQKISHTWMTKIQETVKGEEKRSAIFTWPRIKLDNDLFLADDEQRRFLYAHLFRDLHNLWSIPIVSDKMKLTVGSTAGQNILTVDETDYTHTYIDRKCIIVSLTDWEAYEVVTVTDISSSQITISGTLANTWPVGTSVYPLYDCRIEPEQQRVSEFYKYNSIKIEAKESFEELRDFSYTLPTIDEEIYPTYSGSNLFLKRPLNPVTERYRHPYDISGIYGKQATFSIYDDTRGVFDRTFQCNTKKEIYDFLDFFDANQGRFKTFYTPSFMEDIIIGYSFDATDTTLTTKKLYLTESELIGRHVYIKFKDWSYACREITGVPTPTSITIGSAIGTTVPLSDLSDTVCSFLYEVRFNIDELLFEYVTKNIARTKVGFNII